MAKPKDAASTDVMKAFWDSRAGENAAFYTATGHDELDDAYFELGHAEVQAYSQMFGLPSGPDLSILEIGCGAGRMTKAFATSYGSVTGVDISPVMLEHAGAALAGNANVTLAQVDGSGALPFEDGRFDVVFSYIVLQHIPYRDVQIQYLKEAVRVLRPGGTAAIQLRNGTPAARLRAFAARKAHALRSRQVEHAAWRGAWVRDQDLRPLRDGETDVRLQKTGVAHRWFLAQKPAP